jgi:UDP:flavonoid glycosyltransferase YjiC (YdhE family)
VAFRNLDVLLVADPRFPGGTSTALVAEARALHRAGYRTGLQALPSPLMPPRRAPHPAVAALLAEGIVQAVPPGTPVTARLACIHHPTVLSDWPAGPLPVRADQTVIVAHHPPVDRTGAPQYDIARITRVAADLFGPAAWAPVGPHARAAFAGLPGAPPLTPADWVNIIDPADWPGARPGPLSALATLGRHSRPGREKWPDTRAALLAAYPDAPDIRVRLMGWDSALDADLGPRPANWQVLPFDALPVRRFLTSIDHFAYYHGDAWIEAFGRAPLEAMASGLPCLLPPSFADLFEEGAIYTPAEGVADTVRSLHGDPAAWARQSARAVAVAADLYGPARAVARVADLIGPPADRRRPPPATPRAPARVLYVTSNGIGMGHLTRCLASARRLPDGVQPVILSMSRAFEVARDQGIPAGYLPYWRSTGLPEGPWHATLADEIDEAIRFWQPGAVVFDGNSPYAGLLTGLARHPAVWSVWQRRAMWRPGSGADALWLGRAFDAVVEPGEFAAAFDDGPTVALQGGALVVPPVTFLRRDEALPPGAARAALGLDPARPAVLLQLGSGNNFALGALRATVLGALAALPPARRPQVVHADWRISATAPDLPPEVIRLDTFPVARFLGAFDAAVALAGYNTFHENLAAGLPTLWVSNDNPEQDLQGVRGDHAARCGMGLVARADDTQALLRGIATLADPARRAMIRAACATLPPDNGADRIADWLAGLARLARPRAAADRTAAVLRDLAAATGASAAAGVPA